ncbi:MAG TPA: DciA family protein [Tepidisphaeraceae bacterium]|jgi:hypothetical protein|nr:DciA family protein [Tepidisphaeraceae bacterium]
MGLIDERKAFAELKRVSRVKQVASPQTAPLGDSMIAFFKQSVEKRQTKLGKVAECWAALVPDTLSAHCSLESLSRGTLVVLVDTSSHLYEMKQLLLAGLQDQLLLACKSTGLRKINLKPGRWYDPTTEQRQPRF